MAINDLFKNTYSGKSIFITGHTGFKGSWLALWLMNLGAHVKGYALAAEKNSLYEDIEKSLNCESVIADIRNLKKLEAEIIKFQPDFIFHLAAQPLVRYSYRFPLETFEVNGIGTANLLQAVTKLKKKCVVVVITTDKVYENREQNYAYKETDKLGGYDPYSASKACAEIIVQSYRLSFFNPKDFEKHKKAVASVRAGNVIGGGDYAEDRIVPDIYRALSKSKVIQVRNPNAIRPWQHVLEPLSGYLLLGAKMFEEPIKYSTSYNFGPNKKDVMTVEELVKEAVSLWGSGKYKSDSVKSNLHEAGLLTLDNNKAKNELGWKPHYDSREAIEKTVKWYKRSTASKANKLDLCLEDIKSYSENI